jgi:hypothetical protein
MEVLMTAKLLALTSCLTSGSIEVIVLSLPGVVIRSLAAYLVSIQLNFQVHQYTTLTIQNKNGGHFVFTIRKPDKYVWFSNGPRLKTKWLTIQKPNIFVWVSNGLLS